MYFFPLPFLFFCSDRVRNIRLSETPKGLRLFLIDQAFLILNYIFFVLVSCGLYCLSCSVYLYRTQETEPGSHIIKGGNGKELFVFKTKKQILHLGCFSPLLCLK